MHCARLWVSDKVPRFVAAQIFCLPGRDSDPNNDIVMRFSSSAGGCSLHGHAATTQPGTNFTLNLKSNQFNFLISASFAFQAFLEERGLGGDSYLGVFKNIPYVLFLVSIFGRVKCVPFGSRDLEEANFSHAARTEPSALNVFN